MNSPQANQPSSSRLSMLLWTLVVLVGVVAVAPIMTCACASPETRGIAYLRTLHTSQQQFFVLKKAVDDQGKPRYGTLDELHRAGFIDDKMKTGLKGDYRLVLDLAPDNQSYEIRALPDDSNSHWKRYYINDQGHMTFTKQGIPGPADQPLE